MTDVVVGWLSLLTVDSPRWHDALRITINGQEFAERVREATLHEYSSAEAVIDLLVVAYLAPQHKRVETEGHLSSTLADVKARVGTTMLCALDRASRGQRVTKMQVNGILDNQAVGFGQDRSGYRHISPDNLATDCEQQLTSRLLSPSRGRPADPSIDPVLNKGYIDIRNGVYQ